MGFVKQAFPMSGYALGAKLLEKDKKPKPMRNPYDLSGQTSTGGSMVGGASRRSLY